MKVLDSLGEIDPNKAIVVQNVPISINPGTLENFLEVISTEELDFVYFHGEVRCILVAQFTSPVPDINQVQKRATKRSQCCKVEELGQIEGVLVSDFSKKSSESTDIWELYFESDKNGGEEGCVKDFKVHKNLNLAVVKIENPSEVVSGILCHKHILEGKEVKVQPYYPAFHDPVIEKLSESPVDTGKVKAQPHYPAFHNPVIEKLSESPVDTEDNVDDDGYVEPFQKRPILKPFEAWKQPDLEKSEHVYDEIHFENTYCTIGELAQENRLEDSCKQEVEEEHLYQSLLPTASVKSSDFLAGSNERRGVDQQESDQFSSEMPRNLQTGSKPMLTLDSDNNDKKNEHHNRDSHFSPRNGHKSSPPSGETGHAKQSRRNIEKMQLSNSVVGLLRVTNFHNQHRECKITLSTNTCTAGYVEISGEELDVSRTLEDLYQKLDHVRECKQSFSKEKCGFLKQADKSDSYFLNTALQTKNIKAYVALSESEEIMAFAFSNGEAQKALKEIGSLVQERDISYTDGSIQFLSSSEWPKLTERLESHSKVKVKVVKKQNKIVILGFEDDVETAHKEIKTVLDKNYSISGKPIVITGGKARLFRYCLQDEVDKLQSSVRKKGGNLEYKFDQNTYTIVIKGSEEVLKNTDHRVQQMVWDSWEGPVDLARITRINEKELTELSKWLMSKKGRDLILTFSKENSCVILVRPLFLQTSPSGSHESPEMGAAVGRSKSVPDFARPKRRSRGELEYVGSGQPQTFTVKVKNTTITVKQGDITREKASVLVNVMGRSRKTDESVISANFFKAGGSELQMNFQDSDDGQSSVVLTSGSKNLHCQHVCHMIVSKFDGSDKVKKQTRSTFKEVYDIASKQRATSISFPAVGPGRLLQFPEGYTVECMVSEAVTACNKYNFQQITFVIFDKTMSEKFIKRLQLENPGTRTSTGADGRPEFIYSRGGNEDGDTDPPRRQGQDNAYQQHRRRTSEKTGHDSAEPDRSIAEISMFAASKEHGEKTRQKFQKLIKEHFCVKERIPEYGSDGHIKAMDSDNKKDVLQLGSGKPVIIEIQTEKGKISLFGDKETVEEISKRIYKLLLKFKDAPKGHRSIRHKRGTKEFWLEVCEKQPLPQYWQSIRDKGIISSLLDLARKVLPWKGAHLHNVDIKTYNAVESLVLRTFDSRKVGHGSDAKGLSHQRIQITKVERIENIEVYQPYANKRLSCFRKLAEGRAAPPPLGQISQASKGDIMSARKVDKFLLADMYHQINEHYFFHGTNKKMVANIADKGLDPRHGSDDGMFGPGIYGAECSTKADQYADSSKDKRESKDRKMLLIRLNLGHIFVAKEPYKYKMPPCMQCRKPSCTKAGHNPYDSVVADGKWQFREFVVYKNEQCYPEYVITYDRI